METENRFNNAIRFLLMLLVVATPLIYVTNTNELYEFPKMLFVYIVGAAAIYIFLLRWSRTLMLTDIKLNKALVAFIGIYALSTLFSTNTYTSLWGYYTRFNGGLISMVIYFGLYIVAKTTLTKQELKELFFYSSLTLLPMGIYAVIQHFHAFDTIWGQTSVSRVYSTIGGTNWLAAYAAMLFPFVLYFYLKGKTTSNRLFWLGMCLLAFATIWFTYSISAIIALAVSSLVFIVLNRPVQVKKLGIVLALSFLIALTNLGIFQNKLSDIITDVKKQISYVENVYAQTDDQLSDPGFIRIGLWKGTLSLIMSNPKILAIGTGPETFPYVFQAFRPASLNYSSEWDYVFNKPHNYFLELVSNIGIFGCVAYCLVIFYAIKKKHKVLTPAIIALTITNIFGWPTVSTNVLFFIYLAYLDKR